MKRIFLILLTAAVFNSCSVNRQKPDYESLSVSKAMGTADTAGFEKAIKEREFIFPDDNGAHPEFRTEWWYFTGNLTTQGGMRFGYQLTIFRNAISAEKTNISSEWKSNQIYMGHFTVTNIDNNKFYYFERFSRDGNKLAGAEASPFKVWIEDWSVTQTGKGKYEFPEVRLRAMDKNISLDLELKPEKTVVLQGENGLSMKSKDTGNASYYYSATRIETKGKIILEGKEYITEGYSWLDREWSTSALSDNQIGWDWFSLQLDNNTEIMYYQLRHKDGSIDETSKGSIVFADGSKLGLRMDDIILNTTGEWQNPAGKVYPSGWLLKIPSRNTELKITPAIKNQELEVSVKYWEGSVKIEGVYNGKQITGRGYTELTGYAD